MSRYTVATAAAAGELRIDDELHLSPIVADEEDPELVKLRAALDRRIGEAQLPEIILGVDAEVRFSWIMLGGEPRSASELLMVYAGVLAHGTALSAAETARMIPQLGAPAVRQECAGPPMNVDSPRPTVPFFPSCIGIRSARPGAARIWPPST